MLTDDQTASILRLAKLAPGLEEAEEDFAAPRALIGKLRVQAVLAKEANGRKIVNVSAVLDREAFDLRKSAQMV